MRFRLAVVLVVILSLVSVSSPSMARAETTYSPFGGEASTAKKVTIWTLIASGLALHAVSIFSFVQAGSLGGQRDDMIRANGGDPTTFAGPASAAPSPNARLFDPRTRSMPLRIEHSSPRSWAAG